MSFVNKLRNKWPYRGIVNWAFKKLFGIPKPSALPMRTFGAEPGDYTWEDWEADAMRDYPVRYFLSETVPMWWRVKISMNIEHAWYWLRTHTVHRYHKLDLRQPYTGTDDDYDWGWIDEDRQMLYACFNILVDHIDLRNSSKYHYGTTEKDFAALRKEIEEDKEGCVITLKNQLHFLEEAKALYDYWTVKRKVDLNKRRALLHDWHNNRGQDPGEHKWNALQKAEEEFDKEEEEMLIRLMKIRRYLWT